jgi:hypothetical protein
MDVCAGV